ncbi:MAG: ATP synthase F1 subunit delta [Thermoanaerobaculia bacterium]
MSTRFARPYAAALLQTAPPSFDYGKFLSSVRSIADALVASASLRSILSNPSVAFAAKEGIVNALSEKAGLDVTGRRFLQVVLRNRRFPGLAEIADAVAEALDARDGVIPASVTAAVPLAPPDADRLAAALSGAVGRKVRATFAVDPTLLAGFVARVGSRIYDASALGALEKFKEEADGH